VDGSILHLRDVHLTNDGVYQCVAENKYGMLVSAAWVHVQGTGTCNIYIVKFILNFSHASRMQRVMGSKECFCLVVFSVIKSTVHGKTKQDHLNAVQMILSLGLEPRCYFLITVFADSPASYLSPFCTYLILSAVPLPPTNVKVSHCKNWTAKLSWVPDPSDNTTITHYLIEQESSGNPVVFISLLNVTHLNTTHPLKLSKGSVPRFRIKAVNSAGASRPSLTVETSCKSNETKVGTYMFFTKRQVV